jgi:cellulose synthase/poly-beta-1,6-N-acetylglucosamine synthase-like glycosyltransferase
VRIAALTLLLAPLLLMGVAYVAYPLLLALVSVFRRRRAVLADPVEWPKISVTVPAYNEQASIRETLESLLRLEYPSDRRQIVVISDASTDDTDAIVRSYADRGVELLRLPERRGKTAAENAAGAVVRGDIVVNIDASVRVRPGSLKTLVRAFQDPTVGVASGRDVSIGRDPSQSTRGESGYVGFEMWVRSLETRLDSIVGASGCFYGIRRSLYESRFPEQLSRDFASALIAKEHGLRAVSVDHAVCEVPRTSSLRFEVRRKTRTMARGLETLWYKRHLMNPFRYGGFALMLIGHKLCRWLVYPLLPGAIVGLVLLSFHSRVAAAMLAATVIAIALGIAGIRWRERRTPLWFAVPGFILAANLAGVLAWKKVLRREPSPMWEPTRRPA